MMITLNGLSSDCAGLEHGLFKFSMMLSLNSSAG
jgi:hypothetical protein